MALAEKKDTELSSWGMYPVVEADLVRPERYRDLVHISGPRLARGLGRSYGDAALLSDGKVILTERLDRFLNFNEEKGVLRAEAGVSLAEVLNYFIPRGWFPPVTPGTKFATLGGCVAADVHGKNHHHDGSFGQHVRSLELLLADGTAIRCSPEDNADAFRATMGGMGLTGTISEVELQLRAIESAHMLVTHKPASNLEEVMRLLAEGETDDDYSVAWIDCMARGASLGRSVVMLGHHAGLDELPSHLAGQPLKVKEPKKHSVPFTPPFSMINTLSVRLFNKLFYQIQSRKTAPFISSYDHFFYPLDAILHWNRVYGKKGFLQYQFVLPPDTAHQGMKEILEELSSSRRASFLAVLKRFGKQGSGLLSFPQPGYTLALDLPVAPGLFELLDRLDERVQHYGGRVYLAKDARLKPESFRAMYPRYPDWQRIKAQLDPNNLIRSNLSERLDLRGSL